MKHRDLFVTRREMLTRCGMGMGAVALTSLLGDTCSLQAAPSVEAINPLAPKTPPLPAKAKRVVHLFMNGGCSHVDTFDPKPSLAKYGGKPIPITLKTERRTGRRFHLHFSSRNTARAVPRSAKFSLTSAAASMTYASCVRCTPTSRIMSRR